MIFEGENPRVCQETIYRYIYSKQGQRHDLWWYLRQCRSLVISGSSDRTG